MNEAKHTPGPWAHINPDGFTVRHPQVYSDTGPVCNATWLGDGRIDELRANARLIAAAPELLEALNACVEILNHAGINTSLGFCCCGDPMDGHATGIVAGHAPVDHGDYAASQAIAQARAAIAKATGGAA